MGQQVLESLCPLNTDLRVDLSLGLGFGLGLDIGLGLGLKNFELCVTSMPFPEASEGAIERVAEQNSYPPPHETAVSRRNRMWCWLQNKHGMRM